MKRKKSLKLSLNRETLRHLEEANVQGIRGGISDGGYCTAYCSFSCGGGCQDPAKTEGTHCCD